MRLFWHYSSSSSQILLLTFTFLPSTCSILFDGVLSYSVLYYVSDRILFCNVLFRRVALFWRINFFFNSSKWNVTYWDFNEKSVIKCKLKLEHTTKRKEGFRSIVGVSSALDKIKYCGTLCLTRTVIRLGTLMRTPVVILLN